MKPFDNEEWTSSLDSLLENPFSLPAEQKEMAVEERRPVKLLDTLKQEHREKALQLSKQINPSNQQAIIQYGVAAQAELSKFSHAILNHVQTKEAGPVGEVISELMSKIKEVNPDDLLPAKKRIFIAIIRICIEVAARNGCQISKNRRRNR